MRQYTLKLIIKNAAEVGTPKISLTFDKRKLCSQLKQHIIDLSWVFLLHKWFQKAKKLLKGSILSQYTVKFSH